MIQTTLIRKDGEIKRGNENLLDSWHRDGDEVLWIDMQEESPERVTEVLHKFGAHALAIEDSLRHRHPPKIEFFDDQIFIVFRGINTYDQELSFKNQQLALFIEDKLIISVHSDRSMGVNKTLADLSTIKLKTPLNIGLQVMKNASQIYLDALLDFDGRLSELEDELQARGNDLLLSELTSYKSKLIKLIRTFKYHHSISLALINEKVEYSYIDADLHLHLLMDLNDRFDRLLTLSQMHYDISGDLIDGYLSISAHQLNVAMRILTVITAIFVPLGFLAGLYGMNFEYIPELKHQYGYFYLLGTMGFITITLVVLFKKKRWL